MSLRIVVIGLLAVGALTALGSVLVAQGVDEYGLPPAIPPPLPPPAPPPEDAPERQALVPPMPDVPWNNLPDDLLSSLTEKALSYQQLVQQFTCDETVRRAKYKSGEFTGEKILRYGYLLTKGGTADQVNEYRFEIGKDGRPKNNAVKDEDPFPPAYAWVLMFSPFFRDHFDFRHVDQRMEGFDWFHEIHFRGKSVFTNGKDIRQWEGRVLIDAGSHTPLEIIAEPKGQFERVLAMYRQYQQSFNLVGFRTGEKPLGHHAEIQFRERKQGLTFPTEMRYDTNRAISIDQYMPVKAATHKYQNYLFTDFGSPTGG